MSDIKKILEDAAARSIAFREAIDGRHVEPDADAIAKLDSFLASSQNPLPIMYLRGHSNPIL